MFVQTKHRPAGARSVTAVGRELGITKVESGVMK